MSDVAMPKAFVFIVVAGCTWSEPAEREPPKLPEQVREESVLQTRGVASVRDPVAAWSLTASDGTGLQLVGVDAKAVIEGPLAFTELHLRFKNPENRVREGTFAMTLPSRAAVSRFGMAEGDRMKEAEVVPKALARRAYEDFLHRGIDPALLEKAAGNQFTARVFPIDPHETKHLVISYSQELVNDGYVLPLRGLPTIDNVSVTLDVVRGDGTHDKQSLVETKWQPDRDFVANLSTLPAVWYGNLVAGAFEVAPSFTEVALGATTNDPLEDVVVLVDTSASRALGFPRYLDKAQALVGEISSRHVARMKVVAFDQAPHEMDARLVFALAFKAMKERGPAGASDLGKAAAFAKGRVIIITDGVVTAGVEGEELVKAFGKAERVDVVLAGGIRDEQLVAKLARAGKRPGDVFDLDKEAEASIAIALGQRVHVDVPIEVANATWFYPKKLASLRSSGTQVMVYAKLKSPSKTLEVTVGNHRHRANMIEATPALLQRAAARAEIEELEATLAMKDDAKLRAEIEKRSVAARVVSTQTTMLVLESEQDYVQYGIDRKSLADILVVGPKGLEQTRRTFVASKRLRREEELARQGAIEQARNAGTLGSTAHSHGGAFAALTGTGDISSGFDARDVYGSLLGNEGGGHGFANGNTIGFGRSSGEGWGTIAPSPRLRARTASVPAVSIAMPSVASGSLDKSIIRRYIKRNIAKITYCYERELLGKHDLAGTVSTQFLIAPGGKVVSAVASGMDENVASCVAGVIKLIEFPTAVDGHVQVSYPFTFRRAGTHVEPQPPTDVPDFAPVDPPAPAAPPPVVRAAPPAPVTPPPRVERRDDGPQASNPIVALKGKLADVMKLLAKQDSAAALAIARQWRDEQPGDVLAWIALGEAHEAVGDKAAASRAYGSIIDLFGSRADYRRFAGERLVRTGNHALAVDTYRRAVTDRPDHLTGHRLLAYALVRTGDHADAFAAILAGVDQETPDGRFAGGKELLARDAGMIGAAYIANGGNRDDVKRDLAKRQLALIARPATRFVLYWETDANDVDLHITDRNGDHASFQNRVLESGGELYADVTTGYGPEAFEITGKPSAGPYRLAVHYYSQGPMGYGMGLLQIERFDGKSFTFEDRPFVIMQDRAMISLGKAN